MKKTLEYLNRFKAGGITARDFFYFGKAFKQEFTDVLTSKGCTDITFTVVWYSVIGYFTNKKGKKFIYTLPVIETGDTRIIYRNVANYNDRVGGISNYADLKDLENTLKVD